MKFFIKTLLWSIWLFMLILTPQIWWLDLKIKYLDLVKHFMLHLWSTFLIFCLQLIFWRRICGYLTSESNDFHRRVDWFLLANRLSSTGLDMDLRHVTDFCIKFPIYQRYLNSKCHWTNNDRKILTCQFVVDSRTLPSVWGPNWIITHCTSHLIQ